MCRGLLHIQKDKHKLRDDSWLCIQHFVHKNAYNMDPYIFLVHMQDDWDILGQTCILVLELKENHADALSHAISTSIQIQ